MPTTAGGVNALLEEVRLDLNFENLDLNKPASAQPPTGLGPVPLGALALIEGSASDVEDSSDGSYAG